MQNIFRLLKRNSAAGLIDQVQRMSLSTGKYDFETLKVTIPKPFVYHVEINRPAKRNAMNMAYWKEMIDCFTKIKEDEDCRSIVYSGAGKIFSAGLDLMDFAGPLMGMNEIETGRRAYHLKKMILSMQESFTALEKCQKPVIGAIHGACIGGAIDLITACDIRYCSADAWFSVKEVDIGMAADVGTLQRLPKIVGNQSLVREFCFTGREIKSDEALQSGLVSKVLPDRDSLIAAALELGEMIASKSPVAVQGIKIALNYSRDHSVQDGLEHVATMNSALLQSEDLMKAITASMNKETATFSKL